MKRAFTIALLAVTAAGISLQSYWLNGPVWPAGQVVEYSQLGSSGTLIDGCADWSCVAASAMNSWNANLGTMQFRIVPNATQTQGKNNGRNDLFFSDTMYGDSFGDRTLAITIWWYYKESNTIVEGDIGFNTKYKWDSYRGNLRSGTQDFRRVAIHELGHVLGLGHPDEHGQSVTAVMNSIISNLDDLANDDISGGQAMYGGGGGAGVQINFPPRDETYNFRTWLEATYKNTLGRAAGDSYTDPEGSVVWIQEYLRYRLNMCTDAQATDRVKTQINGGGVPGVCGTPASTTVFPFPPRDQTYAFRKALEDIYRVDLKRGTTKTTVDAEGDVVWIQEYLRYRLNGCTPDVSTQKVLTQISGGGVPAVCK